MTKEQIFEFIKKNPVFALATAQDNKPHVRIMMLYRADQNGIIFNTGENKDVHRQLQANPQVEMCFYNAEEGRQVRISGTVEVLEDLELKKRVVADYPFLQEWVDREGYEVLIIYCLKNGKAISWTMETDFKPKEYVQL
ncbi:MAG TPA: pyridoxamine 5'-phosphate oxidase family protein [Sedimentisphaerales bacterium]|nr:pyridoxamine 5'-phosphate oxidase family protein [Sedimentisphaerales bacterium]